MDFFPYEPFDQNQGQRAVWDKLKNAFKDEDGVAFYRYPIFHRNGKLHREPDILIVHRQYGLWVLECKGCSINNIASIHGHMWSMNNWHSEVETPLAQAEDQMFAIKNRLTEHRETRGLVSYNFCAVLPFVTQQEWKSKGFDNLPCTNGAVIFSDDLTPKAFRNKIIQGNTANAEPQRMMTDDQWAMVKAVLGGTLPSKQPRTIATGTPPNNPIRVISAIESKLKILDEQQQKVAFEVPSGPQRVRGLAGTGKTVLFAKRIAKMHARNPEWKLAYIFFTQALYDEITERIGLEYRAMTGEEPNWYNLHILHSWGAKNRNGFYRNLALSCGKNPMSLGDVEAEIGKGSPGESFKYVCDCLEEQVPDIPTLYDAILIDEGQDLPPAFYRLARATLSDPKRLYWAYDEAQGIGSLLVPQPSTIFGKNSDGTPVVDLGGNDLPSGSKTAPNYPDGISKAHNMNKCYRTPRLLLMTAHAINMGLFRAQGALQGVSKQEEWEKLGYTILDGDFTDKSIKEKKTVTITRPDDKSPHPIDQKDFEAIVAVGTPLIIQSFNSEYEEREWIAQQVANDLKLGFDPCDIVITGPTGDYEKDYFYELKQTLKTYGVKSCIAGVDTQRDIFRMDGHVTISNIFRAKGNEAWKVYASRFHYATEPLSFKNESELHKRNEAFVALTRARVWCVVTGVEAPIFDELRACEEQYPKFTFPAFNKRTIQRTNDENENSNENF